MPSTDAFTIEHAWHRIADFYHHSIFLGLYFADEQGGFIQGSAGDRRDAMSRYDDATASTSQFRWNREPDAFRFRYENSALLHLSNYSASSTILILFTMKIEIFTKYQFYFYQRHT